MCLIGVSVLTQGKRIDLIGRIRAGVIVKGDNR